jgi:hypothetical protein
MRSSASRYLKVALACVASGIVAGLLAASQCPHAESSCQIAPLQYLSSEPTSWVTWSHWVNWLPGIIFGLLFALTAIEPTAHRRGVRILTYGLLSGAVYLVAGIIFSFFLAYGALDEFSLIVWVWPGGLVAGFVGALLLALAAGRVIPPPESAVSAFRRIWLPAIIGAVMGLLFVLVCIYAEQQIILGFPLAFCLWQVPVGLALVPRMPAAPAA